jgi:hypothetical protein
MTLAQLLVDLKNMIGPAGKGTEVQSSGLTSWINDAYDTVVASINDTMPDFYTKVQTASTIAGQQEYVLPDDFEKVVAVSITYDGTNWVKAIPLNNLNQSDVTQTITHNFDVSQPFYYVYKNKIGFEPIPTQTLSNSIKVWYAYAPVLLTEDNDEPDLPRRLQAILKLSAYANYLDQNDEHAAAERMRMRFDAQLERLVDQLSQQQVDKPRTVEIENDDLGLYRMEY